MDFDEMLNTLYSIGENTSDEITKKEIRKLRKEIEKNGLDSDLESNESYIYIVTLQNDYDGMETLGVFSKEEKANEFIEQCKKPFYLQDSIVQYDYRQLVTYMSVEDWKINEFKNYLEK